MDSNIAKKSHLGRLNGMPDYSAFGSRLYLFAVLLVGQFFLSSSAEAVVELGDYGALAADVDASVEYSSNISLNSSEEDDLIYQFFPKLRYRFDQGAIRVEAFAGVDFLRYDDYSENDAEDIKSRIKIEYPYGEFGDDKRFDLLLDAGYNENTSPNSSVQAITETEVIDFKLIGRYYLLEIFYLRVGFEYLDRQSVTAGFDDVTEFALPIEFFYRYSEDLSFGLGYQYAEVDVDDTGPGSDEADSTDHSVYLSAEGKIAPSVTAELRIGGQSRVFDNDVYDDETAFFMESTFQWAVSEQTRLGLMVGSAFDTTIANESRKVFFSEVELQHLFSDKIRGTAALGYEDVDYIESADGRQDESLSFRIGGAYTLIEERLMLDTRVSYTDRDSTRESSNYDHLNAKFSVSYLF